MFPSETSILSPPKKGSSKFLDHDQKNLMAIKKTWLTSSFYDVPPHDGHLYNSKQRTNVTPPITKQDWKSRMKPLSKPEKQNESWSHIQSQSDVTSVSVRITKRETNIVFNVKLDTEMHVPVSSGTSSWFDASDWPKSVLAGTQPKFRTGKKNQKQQQKPSNDKENNKPPAGLRQAPEIKWQ